MSGQEKLKAILSETFDAYRDGLEKEVSADVYAQLKKEFVFHMMDWQEDLKQMCELYEHPDKLSQEEADALVGGFINHARWHINSAYKLLWEDIEPSDAPTLINEVSDKLRSHT